MRAPFMKRSRDICAGQSTATKRNPRVRRSGPQFSMDEAMPPRSDRQQGSSREEIVAEIRERARSIRKNALKMVFEARQGHPGGDMSVADILSALYFGV